MHSQDSIMSTPAIPLPTKVTEKLNRYVPRDATIFYNEKLGWVYERRSSDARPEADVGKVDRKTLEPDENQSPMEHLGPFGTLSQPILCLTWLLDPFQELVRRTSAYLRRTGRRICIESKRRQN